MTGRLMSWTAACRPELRSSHKIIIDWWIQKLWATETSVPYFCYAPLTVICSGPPFYLRTNFFRCPLYLTSSTLRVATFTIPRYRYILKRIWRTVLSYWLNGSTVCRWILAREAPTLLRVGVARGFTLQQRAAYFKLIYPTLRLNTELFFCSNLRWF